jgi:hypothetical protein
MNAFKLWIATASGRSQHRPGISVTSEGWTDVLDTAGVHMSMDGKGRWVDNLFIGRLF